ncbi:OPA3 domain protein [Cladophialophora carrionii]|uniref:OPA3 domain protein n=1 Tax=Cladophialophora carrionii TaxID=86049 RepID=A0A1C1CKD5_9EURO|nr:OPA3 domain protein [Cladophialophora carrionii]
MSLALKFTSLAVRTLSKPIANYIKRQAREHEGFRRTCISFAQTLHRVDMRWRIGLLQDAAAIERQVAKDAAADAAKKHKHSNVPTVKTEAQTKADEEAAAKAAKEGHEPPKPRPKPKIRPLSEAKAIETGANFISEAFLFGVAASLILFESWRQGRKTNQRRNDVAERLAELEESEKAARLALVELEREVLRLRAKEKNGRPNGPARILPKEIYEERVEEEEKPVSWFSRLKSLVSADEEDKEAKNSLAKNEPGPAEKILKQSDKALEERRKQQQALEAPNKETTSQGPKQ